MATVVPEYRCGAVPALGSYECARTGFPIKSARGGRTPLTRWKIGRHRRSVNSDDRGTRRRSRASAASYRFFQSLPAAWRRRARWRRATTSWPPVIDPFAARSDEILGSPGDADIAVVVDHGDIASIEPAIRVDGRFIFSTRKLSYRHSRTRAQRRSRTSTPGSSNTTMCSSVGQSRIILSASDSRSGLTTHF